VLADNGRVLNFFRAERAQLHGLPFEGAKGPECVNSCMKGASPAKAPVELKSLSSNGTHAQGLQVEPGQ
jgi:hypothetical protein